MRTAPILASLLLVSFAALGAQAPPLREPPRMLFGPTSQPRPAIDRCIGAELSAFGVADVVYLAGGQVWIAIAPHLHDSVFPLVTNGHVRDLTRIRGANGDEVWFVDGMGLHSLTMAPDGTPITHSHETVLWAGALRIKAADVDGDAVADAVGVAADGSTLLAYDGSTSTTTTLPLAEQIRDFAAFDWDGIPGDEVAAALEQNFVLYEGSLIAPPILATPYEASRVCLERIVTPMAEYLGGVLEYDVGGGLWTWAFTWDRVNGFAGVTGLREGATRTCAAGDENGDGLTDLVVGFAATPAFDVYWNTSPIAPIPPVFYSDPAVAMELAVGGDTPASTTTPCCIDLDGDGDGELVYGTEDARLAVLTSTTPGLPGPPAIAEAEYGQPDPWSPSRIDITIRLATELPPLPTELLLWRIVQDEGVVELEPTATVLAPTASNPMEFEFEADGDQMESYGYYGVLRQIDNGRPLPATKFVLARDDSPPHTWAMTPRSPVNLAGPPARLQPVGSVIGGYEIDIIPVIKPPPPQNPVP